MTPSDHTEIFGFACLMAGQFNFEGQFIDINYIVVPFLDVERKCPGEMIPYFISYLAVIADRGSPSRRIPQYDAALSIKG
jgi:hypothetical protein